MENIKDITKDFLDDAIDEAKFNKRKFPDWYEFVQDAFSMAAANNVLPGYDNDDVAFEVLSDNRVVIGEFLDSLDSFPAINPFLNPTGFLVYIVTSLADEMVDDYAERFSEIRE